jgi:hypothetical protein
MSRGKRRLALGSIVALLVVATGPGSGAVGAPKKVRIVEQPYARGVLGVAVHDPLEGYTAAGYCYSPDPLVPTGDEGCARFAIRRGDRSVSLAIEDTTGLPVLGMIVSEAGEVAGFFCGSTEDPVALPPGRHMWVWVVQGTCPGTYQPSIPTAGTVVAEFHR